MLWHLYRPLFFLGDDTTGLISVPPSINPNPDQGVEINRLLKQLSSSLKHTLCCPLLDQLRKHLQDRVILGRCLGPAFYT